MKNLYVADLATKVYHIVGFCHYTGKDHNINIASHKVFETEKEVQAYVGQGNIPCAVCQRKRDKLLKEAST